MESPIYSRTWDNNFINNLPNNPSINNNFFNVTMTYHSESGMQSPYLRMLKVNNNSVLNLNYQP